MGGCVPIEGVFATMFADPQSLTILGTAYSLPRVSAGSSSGEFRHTATGTALSIAHNVAKRSRHTVRFTNTKVAPDVLQPVTNKPYSMSTYLVVDAPLFGYTDADLKAYVDSLTLWLTTGTGANVTKLLGGES